MPSYTLIALFLSLFGAIMALIAALRANCGDLVKQIEQDYVTNCRQVSTAHNGVGETCAEVKQKEATIRKCLLTWKKALVIPLWAFAFVVTVITVVCVFRIDWPSSASPTIGVTEIDGLILRNALVCKMAIAGLLFTNIGCYSAAWVAQKMMRTAWKWILQMIVSIQERGGPR